MSKQQTNRVKDWAGTLKKIWRYLSRQRGLLLLILLMVLLSSVSGLLGPYLLGFAIDRLGGDADTLLFLLILLGGTYLLHSVTVWLQNYWMIGVAQRTVYQMRTDLFRHLHKLPISYFTKRQHGELMSRLSNDMENVSQTLNSSFIQVFSSMLTFIGMLGLMLWISPLLTAITLTIVPLLYLGMKWITARTGRYFKEQQRHLGDLNGYVEETLSGQRIVKTFSQETKVQQAFMEKNERLRRSAYWAQVYSGFIPKLMNVLNNMSFAVIAAAGGLMALQGLITVGVIVTFAEYARQFTRPLNDLANQFNTFLSAIAGAERVFEVLEQDEEAKDEQNAVAIASLQGDIRFDQVAFGYGKDGHTLRDVSFHARPGETIALVGPTGAGKTTVTQLLARFYDPDRGRILIDGRDSRSIRRDSLREQMGFVLQDTFLFEGTIRDNIRYGRLDATDEEVEQAAREANAHGFIMKLPQGYETRLSQDGSGISQGQKQLLSIARALLADPSILILDEATSSIDTITEIKIQEALARLMEGRTSLVIAHRLNTIRRADQIVVLQDGTIVEKGSHRELTDRGGAYARMVASQYETKPIHA
ncbi:ABC transporter ATP-binding protein [Xylanibacillus composti]|uniref:Putative ABC transporter ATP-binding protein YfiC n=1 Tax=Xylanibacillus composti TaxID=1572762 RepID=A0A8J4H5D9_9BACL|nr:ABC transporter ATP-binding protein [Xylanibacillus composti]MDT9726032.1 ABC transporter ATP-binding protein [Xylanibacillus composti]GIQ68823.1 putative ABC transporter ATP-binding protein YfiC [Xylanibacillus composti]